MRTAKEWQTELAGETSLESIAEIQRDAVESCIAQVESRRFHQPSTSHIESKTMTKEQAVAVVVEQQKAQCNHYMNDQCTTVACLKRGGYVRGQSVVDYRTATCEAHEIVKALTDGES